MKYTFARLLVSPGLRGLELDAPLKLRPDSGPTELIAVLEQFKVETSPRYKRDGNGSTWCNRYMSDVTRAADCQVPHWVYPDGTPAEPYAARVDSKNVTEAAHELNANETYGWLLQHGPTYGWKELLDADGSPDSHFAQELADAGGLVTFAWRNQESTPESPHSGHVGCVRPSDGRLGVFYAQAGAINSSDVAAGRVFGPNNSPKYFARKTA